MGYSTYNWVINDTNYGVNNKFVVTQGTTWGVGIGTASPAYKLEVQGSVGINGTTIPITNNTYTLGGGSNKWSQIWGARYFADDGSAGAPSYSFAGDQDSGIWKPGDGILAFSTNGVERMRIDGSGFVGINTSAPNRNLTVFGTTRHERIYGYGNNVLSVPNSTSFGTVWIYLGICSPFTTDKIYYRVNTNTSEEEGEITISNTCALPFIQWQRNTYNPNIVQVRARMQYGCGPCEVWVEMRYGTSFGGANTTLQWQAHNGTDYNFTTVNAIGTPGTGTNEKSIVGSEGYFYANSGSITVADRIGIGTTAPTSILDASVSDGVTSGFRFKGWSDASTPYLLSLGTQTYQDIFQIKSVNGLVTMGIVGSIGATPDLAFQTNTTERMRITSGGNVGINMSSPTFRLHVNGGAIGNNIARFTTGGSGGGTRGMTVYSNDSYVKLQVTDNAGSVSTWAHLVLNPDGGYVGIGNTNPTYNLDVTGNARFTSSVTATGFFESSDARLKVVVDEDYRHNAIANIKPKFYEKNGKFEAGYIAQDVQKIYEHAVSLGTDGYLSLSYGQIHTLKIAYLEDTVEEIKRKIAYLEQQLNNK
jgi:hypothetical protein